MHKYMFKLWLWLGAKCWTNIVLTQKDEEECLAVLFTNSRNWADKYSNLKVTKKDRQTRYTVQK